MPSAARNLGSRVQYHSADRKASPPGVPVDPRPQAASGFRPFRAAAYAVPGQYCRSTRSCPSPGLPPAQRHATLAAPLLRLSLRTHQRGRRSTARNPALDSRVDRQLSSPVIPLAPHFYHHRVLPRTMQRPGPARYLDRLLGSPPLPRTHLALRFEIVLKVDGCERAPANRSGRAEEHAPHVPSRGRTTSLALSLC
jgi:hypothetical protein